MSRALQMKRGDSVAVLLEPVEPGGEVEAGGVTVVARDSIPTGHKIALAPIPAGSPVEKYGMPIGTALRKIEPGEHVHVHNVESGRMRGDR